MTETEFRIAMAVLAVGGFVMALLMVWVFRTMEPHLNEDSDPAPGPVKEYEFQPGERVMITEGFYAGYHALILGTCSADTWWRIQAILPTVRTTLYCQRHQLDKLVNGAWRYKDYLVFYRAAGVPGQRMFPMWEYTHCQYDGPEDRRIGCEPTFSGCLATIEELMEDEQRRSENRT